MKLICSLDSPRVCRAAISLQLLGMHFAQSTSMFRGFDEFRRTKPMVKAITVFCGDGAVLMDSSLVLKYAEALANRSLPPAQPHAMVRSLCTVSLALLACKQTEHSTYGKEVITGLHHQTADHMEPIYKAT